MIITCESTRKEHEAELYTAYLIGCLLVAVVKRFPSADGAASLPLFITSI